MARKSSGAVEKEQVRQSIDRLDGESWRRRIDSLNRMRLGRFTLYPLYRRWLERLPMSRISIPELIDLYRLHLRVLSPYFTGLLTEEGMSSRLAKQVDNTFILHVRALLAGIADITEAKHYNKAIHNFELDHKLERMAGYPDRVYLELTDACNLKCPMCTQAVFTHKRTYMEVSVLEQMQSALRYMNLISFVGCGETLFHPSFRDIMHSLPNSTAETRIITNGILLTEDTSRFLIEQQLNHLWVSLDTTESETFEHIRASKLYNKIIQQIEAFSRLKKEMNSTLPHLAMNFVARRCNIEQLPDFVRMAHRLGAEKVNVGYLIVYTRELVQESLYFHKELSDRCMREARRVAEELGIELYLPGLFAESPEDVPGPVRPSGKCPGPYQFVYVHPEGKLGPCCVNDTRLGSLHDAPFEDLWNGDQYRDFRRVVSTPEEDMHCKHCMLEGRKDIHRVEHHVKLMEVGLTEEQVEEIDYIRLAEEVAAAL